MTTKQEATTRACDLPDKDLTPDQLYQRNYHRENSGRKKAARAERRKKDKDFREQDIQRLRDMRATRRRAVASDKFDALVESKREREDVSRHPVFVEINGKRGLVYGISKLAREVGRNEATVRAWMAQKVLPGASVWIADPTSGSRRAKFTEEFREAVVRACRRLFVEDGRGDLDVLRRIIREEFRSGKITYIRRGGRKRFTA